MKQISPLPFYAALWLVLPLILTVSCKKTSEPDIPVSVTDADGNIYNVVIIGKQGWMKENLNVTHYNDGAVIPNVTGISEWASLTTGAWSEYANLASNGNIYGKLYNGFAVETGKLCPDGWRLPTDDDWTELQTFLGGRSVAGAAIRQTGTTLWKSPNEGATNSSNFTALPGGFRGPTGPFYQISEVALWWSSTSENDKMFYWITSYLNPQLSPSLAVPKTNGFAVRCIWGD